MRIKKAHIGRPVDFLSGNTEEGIINGRIEEVRNGIAIIRFWLSGRYYIAEGYKAYIETNSPRIVAVY